MTRIVLGLCVLLVPVVPLTAAGQANPLAQVARLHASLTKGLAAVFKGTDPARAFKPLTVKARPGLMEEVKEAGGTKGVILAMELELLFYSGDEPRYYLRTEVHPAKRGPVFVSFKGRSGERVSKALPFAKYRGVAAPLGAAGAALAKAAVGAACSKLPVATDADFPFVPEGKMRDRMSHDLRRTLRNLPDECARLAAVKSTRAELRVDDVAFGVLGADGKLVGMIKGELRLEDSGALALELGRFKAAEGGRRPHGHGPHGKGHHGGGPDGAGQPPAQPPAE